MKKNIIPDIDLQNEIQKNKILKARDFFKGKSFRFAHSWEPGKHYSNDEFNRDFVVFDNVLLACEESHYSSSSNEPEIIYEGGQPKVADEKRKYWSIVLSGIVNPEAKFKVTCFTLDEGLPEAKDHLGEIVVLGPDGTSGNAYKEYIAVRTASYPKEEYTWELIGGSNTSVDLTNYVTKDDLSSTKSELQNRTQAVRELIEQDYSTTSEVEEKIKKAVSNYYTKEEINNTFDNFSIDGGEVNFT